MKIAKLFIMMVFIFPLMSSMYASCEKSVIPLEKILTQLEEPVAGYVYQAKKMTPMAYSFSKISNAIVEIGFVLHEDANFETIMLPLFNKKIRDQMTEDILINRYIEKNGPITDNSKNNIKKFINFIKENEELFDYNAPVSAISHTIGVGFKDAPKTTELIVPGIIKIDMLRQKLAKIKRTGIAISDKEPRAALLEAVKNTPITFGSTHDTNDRKYHLIAEKITKEKSTIGSQQEPQPSGKKLPPPTKKFFTQKMLLTTTSGIAALGIIAYLYQRASPSSKSEARS